MPYCRWVRWDHFFEGLEGQLASEWEAERAALDTEAERLRLSRVDLRSRLSVLLTPVDDARPPALELVDGTVLTSSVAAVGADWMAVAPPGSARAGATIVPLSAIVSLGLTHGEVLRSARPAESRVGLAERMTLGFVLRDVARRRVPVSVSLASGRTLTGTIDRAGADHLDLAAHDPGAPRRASDVTGYRLVPFASIAWVRLDASAGLPLT